MTTKQRAANKKKATKRVPRIQTERERGESAEQSLDRLMKTGTWLVHQLPTLGPDFARLLPVEEQIDLAEPRLGMTRDQALDVVVRISEGMGANATYARILRGAADVFGLRGFEETGIEEILQAGGISRRTFYQFFHNKQEVLAALFELVISIWEEMISHSLSQEKTAEDKLDRLVRIFVGAFSLAGGLVTVLVTEAARPRSPLGLRYDRFVAANVDILLPLYQELLGRPLDTRLVRARFTAAFGALLDRKLDSDAAPADVAIATELMKELLMPGYAVQLPCDETASVAVA
jgi:AcrR family transcriptional regulator